MTNPVPIREYAEDFRSDQLPGLTVVGFAQEYASVSLLTPGTGVIVFAAVEHSAGHWFEVFPIQASVQSSLADGIVSEPLPMTIASAQMLWRVEWIEEGATGPTLGSNPKTQYAGRGPVPINAVSSARVMAGVLIHGSQGERLLVASSNAAPFKVEIAISPEEVDQMLIGFESIEAATI
ncbi:hypothetical protein EC845_1220 [Comamonas sp. BIGb0124]|uniref:hypothetical protein n=1 Tax=Comamonas sp. BIGb0124 TaxID=2485130 RepID=UPI000FA0CC18|nr:hypothetical protein [Comamonas sp. BIGb0124]ROR25180.1 hypothetical protein EC845_1220 [Comamonas sp. BIGb0124]